MFVVARIVRVCDLTTILYTKALVVYTEVIQIMSGQGSYQLIHNPLAAAGDSTDEEDQPTEGWPDEVNVIYEIVSYC